MLSRFPIGSRIVIAMLAPVALSACEKVPLGAPSESTISVSAPTNTLSPGGSTEITAFVIEQSGTPVQNGTLVRFTATLGTVNPVETETRGGLAVTTFTAANASGIARIRASSGSATGTNDSNVVEIQVGGAAANAVTLSASPTRVPASGGTVTLTAAVVDASGNRLTGVPVAFATTAGTLSAASATTDSSGDARVQLTTNRAAQVTASVAGKSATADVDVGATPSVTLTTTPANPVAGSPVSLRIAPASGTAPRVVVNWGDGQTQDLGIVAADRNVTHTYAAGGSYVITATATQDGDSFTTSTTVAVTSNAGFTLSVSPTTQTAGSPVTLTVRPQTGATPRIVIDWRDGSQTDLGIVTAERVVPHTYVTAGTYQILGTGTSGSETFTASIDVTITARPPIGVTVSASPTSPQRCQSVEFTASVTPSTETISTYQWTIDSNENSEDETITTTGNKLTLVFNNTGTKTISVVATTPDGRTGNGQTQISVVPNTTVVCP